MIFAFEERSSDSPLIERVWRTRAERSGTFTSIAASRWEMVVTRYQGETTMTVRGPETKATPIVCQQRGAEFFGVIFKLGAFMPHLPPGRIMDLKDATLPAAGGPSFWLQGAAWQYPDYENADTFVQQLARHGVVVREPVVEAALRGRLRHESLRTVQRRFLLATGLTPRLIRQIDRARHATALLQQQASILDAVFEAGYFDHAHLIRSLKHYVGQTPTQIMDQDRSKQMSLLYLPAPHLPHRDTPGRQ